MVLQVYMDPITVNSRKVLAGLEMMEVTYELHKIDFYGGEHKSADFTEINPFQTLPAATDGDLTLTESNAILMYAADARGGHAMYPSDVRLRAEVNRWLLFEASSWFATSYAFIVENIVKPLVGQAPDEALLARELPKWHKSAAIIDERLEYTGKWIAGDRLTIADLALASPINLHTEQHLPLKQYPHLARWIADVEALPVWRRTQVAVDQALLPNGRTTNGC